MCCINIINSTVKVCICIFCFFSRWQERTKRSCPHVPATGPSAPNFIGYTFISFDLSRRTHWGNTNIGFCDWPRRLAPLESAAAVVGGEAEDQFEQSRCCLGGNIEIQITFYKQADTKLSLIDAQFLCPNQPWSEGADVSYFIYRLWVREAGCCASSVAPSSWVKLLASHRANVTASRNTERANLQHKGRLCPCLSHRSGSLRWMRPEARVEVREAVSVRGCVHGAFVVGCSLCSWAPQSLLTRQLLASSPGYRANSCIPVNID